MIGDRSSLGVGIVGFGKIAQDQHLAAIEQSPQFHLHSVADQRECTAPVTRFTDVDAMLAAEDAPDVIAICTPPQARFAIARRVLDRGIPALLEKPPCATIDDASSLCEQAGRTGTSLFFAWHSRFAPAVDPAREWLSQRQIGHVRINWREDVRVWHPGQSWIWESGGFGVFDAGINALSIVTNILPQPLNVENALLRFPADCDAPVSAELTMSASEQISIDATFDFLQTGRQTWDIEIETNGGNLQLQAGGQRLLIDGSDQKLEPQSEYATLYAHFADLIEGGRIDADLAPLGLVSDALRGGRVEQLPPLHLLFSDDENPGAADPVDTQHELGE